MRKYYTRINGIERQHKTEQAAKKHIQVYAREYERKTGIYKGYTQDNKPERIVFEA